MSESWVDTEAVSRAAVSWSARGDAWFRVRFELEVDLGSLGLLRQYWTAKTTLDELAGASSELWWSVSFVRSIVAAAELADGSQGGFDVAIPGDSYSSHHGDLDGTFRRELRSPWSIAPTGSAQGGRAVVKQGLGDLARNAQIYADEFQLVEIDGNRFVVVLPGVTDLSNPELGLNKQNRTVRDLDQFAVPSSHSTSVSDNRYAEMVWLALLAADVPTGAELLIIGHSFGADTALDLAADRRFNGPSGFDVTHVVAAGYNSRPQLEDVDSETRVLVLQNSRDAAVIAESVASGHVSEVVQHGGGLIDSAFSFDPVGSITNLGGVVWNGAGAAADGVTHLVDRRDSIAEIGAGLVIGRSDWVADGFAEIITLEPGVDQVSPNQIVDVFEGGAEGVGHHPNNYVDHIASIDDPAVAAFFDSIDAAGYAADGTVWAVDVSVPE